MTNQDDSGCQLRVFLDVSLEDDPAEAVAPHEDGASLQSCRAEKKFLILNKFERERERETDIERQREKEREVKERHRERQRETERDRRER